MIKKVFILLGAVVILSCQDTKTNQNETSKSNKNNVQKKQQKNQTKNNRNQIKSKYELDTISKLQQEELIPFLTEYGKTHPQTRAVIETKFGDIELELFTDTPLHRANFIYLANLGYFDTTYFYRVDEDFVIQGGNSDNVITSRMRKRIGSFLIPKEFHNKYRHRYGTLAAAKYARQNVSKASSPFEFYILMDKEGASHLDQEHTIFGKVTKGMSVAEKINQVETGESSQWPVENVEIKVRVLD
ncbi:MAG TPA: peptidylprolyl isomerase [Flavobacteriaceae bacterium]|nr:peptidylprolyl isomerase [Flavobacteriaceae bacterium]